MFFMFLIILGNMKKNAGCSLKIGCSVSHKPFSAIWCSSKRLCICYWSTLYKPYLLVRILSFHRLFEQFKITEKIKLKMFGVKVEIKRTKEFKKNKKKIKMEPEWSWNPRLVKMDWAYIFHVAEINTLLGMSIIEHK